jgi:glucose-1-phosphate thymidylyltransferase
MQGDVVIAFADTLFRADFVLDKVSDGVIWVKKVEDPSAFGVVKLDDYGFITDFVEKPQTFVSDLAIIGIYYFKSAEKLMDEINFIMNNDIKVGGEYQLTTALENLRQKGAKFSLGKVDDWMDCGNKNASRNQWKNSRLRKRRNLISQLQQKLRLVLSFRRVLLAKM